MVRHELYVKYKTVPTEEERERARLEYLDRLVLLESFKWEVIVMKWTISAMSDDGIFIYNHCTYKEKVISKRYTIIPKVDFKLNWITADKSYCKKEIEMIYL